jgi:hypothetical protein
MRRQASIRDQLEADAWRNHPNFSRRFKRITNFTGRKSLNWRDRALLIITAVLLLLLIVRVETSRADDSGGAFWGLEFQGAAGSGRAVALDTDIRVEVTGLTARINVIQAFQNSGREWEEAVYRYPLPEGSAVDRMQLHVGQRVLEGQIREKEEARRQYQQARSSGKLHRWWNRRGSTSSKPVWPTLNRAKKFAFQSASLRGSITGTVHSGSVFR